MKKSSVIERPAPAAEAFQIIELAKVKPSPTNPRKRFDEAKLADLAESIRSLGCIQPIVVRPIEDGYELVAGERRYRASLLAGQETIPAIVRELDDAAVLEIQVVENNQREDVHPLEETEGYRRLLDSGAYGTERVEAVKRLAGKLGRSESYVWQRLKLADLIEPVREAFLADKITAGHAILIARLNPEAQERAFNASYSTDWQNRVSTMPVAILSKWIQENVLLKLSAAAWRRDDADLIPEVGACNTCPKRTGANAALFDDIDTRDDRCTDGACYRAKRAAFEARKAKEIEEKHGKPPMLVATNYSSRSDVTRVDDYLAWRPAKEGETGAVPALVVDARDNKDLFKETWVKPAKMKEDGSPSAGVSAERREQLRQQKVETQTRNEVYAAIRKEFEREDAQDRLLAANARLLSAVAAKLAHEDKGPEHVLNSWVSIAGSQIHGELTVSDYSKPRPTMLLAFAEVLGIDVDLIRKETDYQLLSAKQKKEIDEGLRPDPRQGGAPIG